MKIKLYVKKYRDDRFLTTIDDKNFDNQLDSILEEMKLKIEDIVIVVRDKIVKFENLQNQIVELELQETKKQIELRATNFVKKQLSKLDYDNEGEVALYATNEDSEWHDEAVALQKWIEEVYKKMYELLMLRSSFY